MNLRLDARAEALRLLDWWANHLPDHENGGFYGEVDAHGQAVRAAPKSAILNARMLWFFSAMAQHLNSVDAQKLAGRAADYLRAHFLDPEYGGIWWLLDHKGNAIDTKKQTYAQAFTLYAFVEYYRASGDNDALRIARRLQVDIETHCWDRRRGGYIEALDTAWSGAVDQRLSDKDADLPKTMNTHLHVLEAYTNLYRVAPDAASKAGLRQALDIFLARFLDATTHHLCLFYDMDWNDHTKAISFGHEIEASWLIWEAAEVLADPGLVEQARTAALTLARVTQREGLNAQGGLSYESWSNGETDAAGEWWGQAEGLVGFLNAWQLSGDQTYLATVENLWAYAQRQFGAGGSDEWTWYAADSGRTDPYRAGLWKCPYHNGRAMIELDRRLGASA